jgi:hypothetical protein
MSSETQDIRVWAKEQGLDIAPKGKIPVAIREQWEGREVPPAAPAEESPASPTSAGERKPAGRKRGLPGLLARGEQADKPQHRRVSIEGIVSSAWGLGAMLLCRSPQSLPMARVLDMQAPVAGIIVNDVARGTVVDKVLQPFARAGASGEKAMALIGPPLLVGIISANPGTYPVLKPVLKASLMSWMEISAPAMKKAEQRAARWKEEFGGVDIDSMIEALFAVPPEMFSEQPSPDEEDNIRRAGE